MAHVSVIIPCYNHEAYVRGCLDSVFRQEHEDIELVVIDDCSTDGTFALVESLCHSPEYQGRFTRVHCERNEENLGAHATLNKAIRGSSGQYVAIVNSDDEFTPARIGRMVRALEESGSQFGFSNYVFFDRHGKEITFHPILLSLRGLLQQYENVYPAMGFLLLRQQVALSTGNFVFTRELYDRLGGFKPLRYCHDWDFALQALRITEPTFLDETLYRYRIHDANSFQKEKPLAIPESEYCLKRYFRGSELEGCANPLAPSMRNWPGLYSTFLKQTKLEPYYTQATTGYYTWHKTVEKQHIVSAL